MKRAGLLIVAALGFAGVLLLFVFMRRSARERQAEVRSVNEQTAKTRAEMRARIQQIAASTRELARLTSALEEIRRAKMASSKTSPKSYPDWVAWFKTYESRQKDPKEQLREYERTRAQLRTKYGPLYRKLGLSTDRIEAFEANEARYAEMQADLFAAITAEGLSFQDPAVGDLYDHARKQEQAAQRDLLGEQSYEQFAQYQRSLPAREVVRGLAAAATVSGAPLTNSQLEQLVQIIANADPQYNKGGTANLLEANWERADAATSPLLTPQQREILFNYEPPTGAGRHWSVLNRRFNDAVTAEMKAAQAAKSASVP